jgi:thymidylate synthase
MDNLDKQYITLLQSILDYGVEKQDRTGTGTKSIFGYTIRHNMKDGFPLLTTKKMPFRLIATELIWFLRGDTNIKYLVDNNCHIWDGDAYKNYLNETQHEAAYTKEEFINLIKTDHDWAKVWGDLGPVYGKQWRDWGSKKRYGDYEPPMYGGIDQIQNLINDLKTNPDSRRLMVSAWNVGELDQMVLPPCHYGFQVYTRELSRAERVDDYNSKFENKIEVPFIKVNLGDAIENTIDTSLTQANIPTRAISLMWNQRSADAFLGLPFNIASYGLLLEIIAKAVNMVPDELIGNLGDTHLYLNHIEQAKEQLTREPYPLPTLNINTEWWPTESGGCGVSPIDAVAVVEGFSNDNFCKCLLESDLQLSNYQSHPHIKAQLSN